MKVIKVIVDEMPEVCNQCPLFRCEGFRDINCVPTDWKYTHHMSRMRDFSKPDHRCLCEVEEAK